MSRYYAPKIAIIADDLSSAADASAPFAARGLSAVVSRNVVPTVRDEVCAVDAGTRSLRANDAADATRKVTEQLRDAEILFKTVDSTLRGNVRLEIQAAFEASGRSRLVIAPAFPAAGRTTTGGRQYVDGVPVDMSRYANDPVHRVQTSRLSDLGPLNAESALILNAQTQQELEAQVWAIAEPETTLWVGSPGLAQALASRFGSSGGHRPLPQVRGQSLVVVGSANPVSHQQAAHVREIATVLTAPSVREENSEAVLTALATEASAILLKGGSGALIATGGDTMEAILHRTNTQTFQLFGEVEPGCPVGRAQIAGRDVLLCIKAGGFGDTETLVRAIRTLTPQSKECTP